MAFTTSSPSGCGDPPHDREKMLKKLDGAIGEQQGKEPLIALVYLGLSHRRQSSAPFQTPIVLKSGPPTSKEVGARFGARLGEEGYSPPNSRMRLQNRRQRIWS